MRKGIFRLLCLLLAAVFLLTLCSCASDKKSTTPYSIAADILLLCSKDIEMSPLTSNQTAAYFGIDAKYLEEFTVYKSLADDRYDTVAVFGYKNKQARSAIADAIAQHLKTNENTAQAVNNTEYKKLQNRIVMEQGDKLILVVSDNAVEIEKMLKKKGAKKF